MTNLNQICWSIATLLLVGCGIYYSFKLNFIQFNFKEMIKSFKYEKKSNNSVSPFETLTLALAARIGVGSLAGIALGIYNGGIGVIFWIWLSTLFTLPNTFIESLLAVVYRKSDGEFYKGGPAYYIGNGLGYKKLAVIYAIVISLCYLGGFLAIQSNTISASVSNFINIPNYVTGIIVALISFFIIFKGLKSITKFTAKLVPVMGIGYLLICLIVIVNNIDLIPPLIINIVKEAFNIKAFGFGIFSSMIIGIQRGIFSSESGIGTGACASGTSDTNSPIKQGMIQMIGIYFTTFVICTSTAIIILTSNIDVNSFVNVNGIEIVQSALNYHLGSVANSILLIVIITFAFSTVVSGYYYGESNIKYLFKNINEKGIVILKIIVVLILLYGAIASPSKLWNLVDIGVAILAIINVIAIFMLRKDVFIEMKNYRK